MPKLDTDQLPPGAQKSVGNTQYPVGVIDDGVTTEGNVLQRQAQRAAELRSFATPINRGADMGADVLERVQTFAGINPMAMNAQTLQGLANGTITRDQQFVGNNSQFTGYYLEPAAKYVIPQYTPLRNMLPRLPGPGIDTINWRAITDYFNGTGPTVANAAVAQGASSIQNKLQYVWVNASNVFKMMNVSDVVTFESEIYGKSFEGDVRATVAAKLIPALMLEEELWIINSSQLLWPPVPSFNGATTAGGGSLAAQSNWIIVTAVNSVGETLAYGGSSPVALNIVTAGGSSTATININRVPGATSYHVYVGSGATQPATSAMWLQTTAVSSTTDAGGFGQGYLTITAGASAAFATSGTAYSTVVTAGNTATNVSSGGGGTPANLALTYDGILSLTYLNAGTASTAGVHGETPLIKFPAAANGSLALTDIDGLLEAMYLNAHADPEVLFVGVKDHKKLSYLVAQGTNFRVNTSNSAADLSNIIGGQRVTKYINQTTGRLMDVVMLPYLAQGTIIAASLTLPFPVAAITRPPLRVEYNREMWAVEYPPDQSHPTEWAYSAYQNVSVINQFLGGTSILTGISLT
jgi:hypothetical protein